MIVVANLKNNLLPKDLNKYLTDLNKIKCDNLIVCPSDIYIPYFLKHNYSVGMQKIGYKINSTGEIIPLQACFLGIRYVILNHYDNRSNNDNINIIIKECVKYNLNVILCIGETNEERKMLKTSSVLKRQLIKLIGNIKDLSHIYIAYEPNWAIGSDKLPSIQDIKDIITYIKETVRELFNYDDIKVLYGGSINNNNIDIIKKINNLDGILLGKIALDTKKLLEIIEKCE